MPKPKRARNGQGSIYETTYVDKRSGQSKTRWQAQVVIPQELGEPKRTTVYGKTYAEVKEKMDKLTRQVADGTVSNTDQTVSQYLEQWLKEKARHVSPRTLELYGNETIRPHINPRIGKVKLAKLTPMKVQMMVSDIADTVGVRTANICRTVLFSAMKQAIRWQLVARNPVEAVDPLKETPKEKTIWTAEESVKFLDTARAHRLYAFFHLAMATGLRKGELINLRWDDINGSSLNVKKSKTQKGKRRVALSPDVLMVLEDHRARQAAEKAFLGESWGGGDLVFTSEIGTQLNPRNLTRTAHILEKRAGVRHATIHDLRHLNVSIRRKMGQDAKLIADQIGHTNPGFTMRLYTHLFEDDRADSAIDLSVALGSSTPPEERN